MKMLIDPADRIALLRILQPLLPKDGRLVLFGSRARGDAGPYSDIDLAVKAPHPFNGEVLATMRERIEQSNVPYRVDVLDYANAPTSLRKAIDCEGIEWTA